MTKSLPEIVIHCSLIGGFLLLINTINADLRFGVFRIGHGEFLLPSLAGTFFNVAIFYSNSLFLIPRYLRKHRRKEYWGCVALIFIACCIAESISDVLLLQSTMSFPAVGMQVRDTVTEVVLMVAIVNALVLLASFGYGFSKERLVHERRNHILEDQKLKAELSFLKAQINPHFLFNTLNNLFSMALQNNDAPTAEGISQLAALMRYMLYESADEIIPMEKELAYIKNYIALQKLRFGGNKNSEAGHKKTSEETVIISLSVSGDIDKATLAPMIFIPFIENAFKHGISMNTASHINISFAVQGKEIDFRVTNTLHAQRLLTNSEASGVGLTNVRQRLAGLYPGNHHLEVTTNDSLFTVHLRLPAVYISHSSNS